MGFLQCGLGNLRQTEIEQYAMVRRSGNNPLGKLGWKCDHSFKGAVRVLRLVIREAQRNGAAFTLDEALNGVHANTATRNLGNRLRGRKTGLKNELGDLLRSQ